VEYRQTSPICEATLLRCTASANSSAPAMSPAIGRSRNTDLPRCAAATANSACAGGGTAKATASQ
jgi:hypothetical protein